MTKDTHNCVFGFLALVALVATAAGMAWWFSAVFVPKIEWSRIASEWVLLPGGLQLALGGIAAFLVIIVVGRTIEPN